MPLFELSFISSCSTSVLLLSVSVIYIFSLFQGIIKRDEIVFTKVRAKGIPIAMVTSGGYTRETAKIIADSFTPRENNRLLDYYKIISISRPILAARANMGHDFISGQYGCLFSRCRKYVINSLIHGHFHIGLVIIPSTHIGPRLHLGPIWGSLDDNQPIWKCPCINL
jgi:hypothetical protein